MGHLLARGYVVRSHSSRWQAGRLTTPQILALEAASSLAASNGGGPRICMMSGWRWAAALLAAPTRSSR